jgi:hypothetical protein
MDQRDQELLQKQLRAINPAPRHDGVIIATLLVGFLAGMTLGGFLVGHTNESMRVASNDVAPTSYPLPRRCATSAGARPSLAMESARSV